MASVLDHRLFTIDKHREAEHRGMTAMCVCGHQTACVNTHEQLLEVWASHIAIEMAAQVSGLVNSWAREMAAI